VKKQKKTKGKEEKRQEKKKGADSSFVVLAVSVGALWLPLCLGSRL
jgi:hypothetical protein